MGGMRCSWLVVVGVKTLEPIADRLRLMIVDRMLACTHRLCDWSELIGYMLSTAVIRAAL